MKNYLNLISKKFRPAIIAGLGLVAILLAYIVFYSPWFNPAQTYRGGEPQKLPAGMDLKMDNLKEKIKPLLTEEAQAPAAFARKKAEAVILRDPFKVGFSIERPVEGGPPAEPPAPAPRVLQLQGIFTAGGKKSAIIDDKLVSVGDSISGWVVARITDNQVTVYKNGKSKNLYIKLGVY